MSVRTRFLVSSLLSLVAAPLFALYPAARNESRMVFSPTLHRIILYGGNTAIDRATGLSYELNDTWTRTATRWIQLFPAHNPGKRASHVMVYDSKRDRIILFGGRAGLTQFNDMWAFVNNDWTEILTPNAPPARYITGGAYDIARDRVVLFGGNQLSADGKTVTGLYDTWEFDGTTWVERSSSGPKVNKPILVYDVARQQTIMLGIDDKGATLMYQYLPDDATWKQLTPATLPGCVNEGQAVYVDSTQKVFYTGGVCAGSSATEDNMEWDGTNWTKIEVLTNAGRVFGGAIAYDVDNDLVVLFGGSSVLGTTGPTTLNYRNGVWVDVTNGAGVDPAPRSLFTFVSDPINSSIWMFGGVDDNQTFSDFWRYRNGMWDETITGTEPAGCVYPLMVYDTDRQKMPLICNSSATYEFDPTTTTWTAITGLKDAPPVRRFSSMVYDQNLKKTVLFGGYDTNYIDQTWTWDGKVWTRVGKKNPPPPRALAAMWYDPTLKKTVMYGGLGRVSSTDRLTRFDDMWTFDGTVWTQLKPSGGTPGLRFGAEVAVDPRTNKVLLFGGLRVEATAAGGQEQIYSDDTWEWDGNAWTKLSPAVAPPARENAGITFDPIRNELVMFSGFAGIYRTDTWSYTGGAWRQRIENPTQRRRGAAH